MCARMDRSCMQVALLSSPICVLPCALGQVAKERGVRCESCDELLFSLWLDTRAGGRSALELCAQGRRPPAISNITFPICEACPANAKCSGGAVIAPLPGYWHSSPNSTLMHACPNREACRKNADAQQQALIKCQQSWYASRVPGQDVVKQMTASGITAAPPHADSIHTNASSPCLLWGPDAAGKYGYMQRQCNGPFTANVCAACQPRHFITAEFTCT